MTGTPRATASPISSHSCSIHGNRSLTLIGPPSEQTPANAPLSCGTASRSTSSSVYGRRCASSHCVK